MLLFEFLNEVSERLERPVRVPGVQSAADAPARARSGEVGSYVQLLQGRRSGMPTRSMSPMAGSMANELAGVLRYSVKERELSEAKK